MYLCAWSPSHKRFNYFALVSDRFNSKYDGWDIPLRNFMAYVVERWVFNIILPPETLGRTPPVWKSSALPGLSSVYASHSCGFCFCTVRGCHCPRLDQFIILIRAITRTHPRVIKFWGFRSHRGQQNKLGCLITGLPDPICVSNLPGHSFRFKSSRKAPQDLFNTKMYMRELSFSCLVTLQVVKASRSYFSSYRGSPQTKVSGSSKKGSRRSWTGSDSRK